MKTLLDWISDHDNKIVFTISYIAVSLVLSVAISLFWLLFAVLIHLLLEIIRQKRERSNLAGVLLESLWETKLDFALVVFALWLAVYLDFIFGVAGVGAMARTGAHAATRTGNVAGRAAQTSARFAAWNRTIRAIMLSLDDVANGIRFFFPGRKNKVLKPPASAEVTNQATGQSTASPEVTNQATGQSPEAIATANQATSQSPAAVDQLPAAVDQLPAAMAGKKALQVQETPDPEKTSWSGKWKAIDYTGVLLFAFFMLLIIFAPVITGQSFFDILQIIKMEFHPFPL